MEAVEAHPRTSSHVVFHGQDLLPARCFVNAGEGPFDRIDLPALPDYQARGKRRQRHACRWHEQRPQRRCLLRPYQAAPARGASRSDQAREDRYRLVVVSRRGVWRPRKDARSAATTIACWDWSGRRDSNSRPSATSHGGAGSAFTSFSVRVPSQSTLSVLMSGHAASMRDRHLHAETRPNSRNTVAGIDRAPVSAHLPRPVPSIYPKV